MLRLTTEIALRGQVHTLPGTPALQGPRAPACRLGPPLLPGVGGRWGPAGGARSSLPRGRGVSSQPRAGEVMGQMNFISSS